MKRIEPNAKNPPQTHASGILADQDLFIAGQVGVNKDTGAISKSFGEQTAVTLANLASVVEAAGGSVNDIVKLTIYVANMPAFHKELTGFMSAFSEVFSDQHIPAMTLIGVTGLLSPDYLLEIDGQAKIAGAS